MDQQLYAIKLADIYNSEIKKRLLGMKKGKYVFPPAETLYNKLIVKESEPINKAPKAKKMSDIVEKNKINQIKQNPSQTTETTSTSSKEDTCDTVIVKDIHHLFSIKDRSRFNFPNGGMKESVDIPKFIQELILKKVSRHKLTKNIRYSEDILYSDNLLENEYKNNNPWAQFIIENKTFNDDWEFVQDFDYINGIILNKCQSYKY
jgi:hypothetical protein